MNGDTDGSAPLWRTVAVPTVVTLAAIFFWLSYYRNVGWWPIALVAIFLVHLALFQAVSRKSRKSSGWDMKKKGT